MEALLIAAFRCPVFVSKGKKLLQVMLYTADVMVSFKPCDARHVTLIQESVVPNPYQRLPVVEWRNNRYCLGDYEMVLSQIDLYDAAQSDTVNYMQDLNDAMLVISGDLDADKYSTDDILAMKQANLLLLEGGQDVSGRDRPLSADYLYKQYDVVGKEAYNKRLQDDIHKFSHTPDLSDDSFSQNSSGVALKYKLFGLEQVRGTKEKYFLMALRERYRIVSDLRESIALPGLDPENLRIIFTENLPEDEWSEIKDFYGVGGQLSQRTLLERLSFVENADVEMGLVESESAPPDGDRFDFEKVTDDGESE